MKPNWFVAFPVEKTDWFLNLESTPEGTRYFHPDDLHVTFSFLGPIDEEDAMRAWAVAKKLEGGPFRFDIGRIEPFGGNRARPAAYAAVPTNPVPELNEFLAIHRNEVARAAFARPDSRTPRPHITIARPRRRATERERDILHDWARDQRIEGVTIHLDRLALYTWSDEDDDRLFRLVDSTRLAGGEAAETEGRLDGGATEESSASGAAVAEGHEPQSETSAGPKRVFSPEDAK